MPCAPLMTLACCGHCHDQAPVHAHVNGCAAVRRLWHHAHRACVASPFSSFEATAQFHTLHNPSCPNFA